MARTHVALLRAINVGGRSLLMKDLAAMCEAAGCRDVVTYIQSGNVAFRATAAVAKKLPVALARGIAAHVDLAVPVIVRDVDALAAVARGNPFIGANAKADDIDTAELHVGFLAEAPDAARVAALDPRRSPPDEFVVRGAEVYFRFPGGVGKTKLTTPYFDAKLATTITLRNWRTVHALLALLT
jgi:uncharacterized protein (DUF1697 family)